MVDVPASPARLLSHQRQARCETTSGQLVQVSPGLLVTPIRLKKHARNGFKTTLSNHLALGSCRPHRLGTVVALPRSRRLPPFYAFSCPPRRSQEECKSEAIQERPAN